ncbi:uncharacterized protein LOC117654241 [Thrips palmi]|uniref:Uncharacterized protein LOC117654241 n=1 Tax=Thrips palmi TaxID=161013 RepID=A0A6P9AGL3_THRPL|nr:uncharacterized protein LOC117654241 [Thrips palmi]XP_034256455.1 uncharacterized protein LOC117654241 [Thrips palmi]
MTTRKFIPKFFAKPSDGKKTTQGETPTVDKENFKDSEFEDFSSTYKTQKLHRSRSGRLKEFSKLRLALSKDTFEAPSTAQSAPVTSMSKPASGLGGRELPGFEKMRVSRSLQSHINPSADGTSAPPRNSSGEDNFRYGLDENEIF